MPTNSNLLQRPGNKDLRRLPLIVLLVLLVFTGILIVFYVNSVSAVKDALTAQAIEFTHQTAPSLATNYAEILREASFLTRNKLLPIMYDHDISDSMRTSEANDFVRWFKSRTRSEFKQIAFTDSTGATIYPKSEHREDNVAGFHESEESTEVTTVMYDLSTLEESAGMLHLQVKGSELLTPSVQIIARTKFRNVQGAAIAMLPLGELISDKESRGNFVIFNYDSGRIVYNRPDLSLIGSSMSRAYPSLWTAYHNADPHSDQGRLSFSNTGEEFVGAFSSLEVPSWTIINFIGTDKYLHTTRTTGRIALSASIVFVVSCGILIYRLLLRVRHASHELEGANALIKGQNALLSNELDKAHELQMALMPTSSPNIMDYRFNGICKPATQVGGDFYQYHNVSDKRWTLTLADVTGHGMEAAIPGVLMSGILDNFIESGLPPFEICHRLNNSLHRVLPKRTFVCFSLVDLNLETGKLCVINGGCPYPYVYRAKHEEIDELVLDAFPLGLRTSADYTSAELTLAPGDCIILCSDGVIEALNTTGDVFGFEKTKSSFLEGCRTYLDGGEIINHIFTSLASHTGSAEQDDDQTVVILSRNQEHYDS